MHLWLLLAFLAGSAYSAKILVLLPFPGYSHTMPFMPIFKELGRRGHELTMVTPFPQDPLPKGFKEIHVDLSLQLLQEKMDEQLGNTSLRSIGVSGAMFQLMGMWPFCGKMVTPLILEKVKPVLPPPGTKFDLIITEPFFCMEPLMVASHLYKAPIVATLPMPLAPCIASAVGHPYMMSYVPNSKMAYTDKMDFLQRVWNFIVGVVEVVSNDYYHMPRQDKRMRDMLGLKDVPYLGDLRNNISLILTSTHFSMNYPRPSMNNVLEVAGVSTATVKPLPKDLEDFMNGAKDGVILFSWGSHYKANDVGPLFQSMMKVFSKLKQRVLFKWFDPNIPNKPDNVLIQKWVPQPSILNHNKTVLFISHSGINSVYEAAYFGVPVIGTPLFGDQPHNIRILENFGMGISLSVDDIEVNPNILSEAINKIISNPSYKENAMKRREMVRDRPMPPLEEAVYWVEYVMRHGASQLRPASLDLPWYSIALLDVIGFLIAVVTVPFVLMCCLIRICISKLKKSKSKPKTSKKHATKEKKNK